MPARSDSMKVNLGIWQQLTRLIIGAILVALVVGVGYWYVPLRQQNQRLREDNYRLKLEVQKLEDSVREREKYVNDLKNDPRTIERMARSKLGLSRTGETVFYFETAPVRTNAFVPVLR